ncbi:hypothetical protein ACMSSJ_13855 [Kerstersia gyiorum]|uniref:hypothetical protein n=1 Tax=Kerstersia gyiorum TaxID=206506 RepID=UPI0039EAD22A
MWAFVGKVAVLATLLGVSATSFVDHSTKAWLAFFVVLATCAYICWRVYLWTKKSLTSRYPNGYATLASFVRYTTGDGDNYVYELFRHIQIKLPVLRYFDHNFTWSGSCDPKIESELQETGDVKPRQNADGSAGSTVRLKFNEARLYNDSEIVHLKMNIDDSDQASSPHLAQSVMLPIRLLNFRVELLHAPPAYVRCVAKLSRRPIAQAKAEYEHLRDIRFDPVTKSYSHQETNPEPGYEYKLSWDRPSIRKRGKK